MITANQQKYLDTIPKDKVARVVAFDPATQQTAQEIMSEIRTALPKVQIFYAGSSALGIAGENDIDLTALAIGEFQSAFNVFTKLYGAPKRTTLEDGYAHWEFVRNGFPVELHLNDRMKPYFQEQLDTQKILEQNTDLCLEYERIKLQSNGLPWREYTRRKYEFWNRILGLH
jgi:GrpB-like predicted nucleotidyltransferase (UPF0157 family)